MKYTEESISLELEKLNKEMHSLNSEIEKMRYTSLPSEVEPGTWYKIKLPEGEFLRRAGEHLQQYAELKRDRRALEYMLRELRDEEKRRKNIVPKEKNSDDYSFNLDFESLASRRAARLLKIAACACDEMGAEDHEDEDYMSHQNATAILEQAIFIAKTISEHTGEGHKLDDWLEDKISKVADDMDEIFKYLKHGKD
jgi:hypothetical protein